MHASVCLSVDDDTLFVKDEKSTNGTFIDNEKAIAQHQYRVHSGTQIVLAQR